MKMSYKALQPNVRMSIHHESVISYGYIYIGHTFQILWVLGWNCKFMLNQLHRCSPVNSPNL